MNFKLTRQQLFLVIILILGIVILLANYVFKWNIYEGFPISREDESNLEQSLRLILTYANERINFSYNNSIKTRNPSPLQDIINTYVTKPYEYITNFFLPVNLLEISMSDISNNIISKKAELQKIQSDYDTNINKIRSLKKQNASLISQVNDLINKNIDNASSINTLKSDIEKLTTKYNVLNRQRETILNDLNSSPSIQTFNARKDDIQRIVSLANTKLNDLQNVLNKK